MSADPRAVIEFWFGAGDAPDAGQPRAQWFSKDEAFDALIRERFGATVADGLAGRLEHWRNAPDPALAYLIVLDQFTRNVYRDTPMAFAGDGRALAAARHVVENGIDLRHVPIRRSFCYLPFEHSEDIEDQRESLRLFATLRDDPHAGGTWEWALKHHDVIERFGRFPHRNAVLGRASTPDEIEFLSQPGSRF